MSEKTGTSHPFGKKLTRHLQQNGLLQGVLAKETSIPDSVISHMKNGRRLRGETSRERVLKIIEHFHKLGTITTQQEANEFLAAAGMLPLRPDPFDKWCQELEPRIHSQLLDISVSENVETANPLTPPLPLRQRDYIQLKVPIVAIPKRTRQRLTIALILAILASLIYYCYLVRGWHVRINRSDDINVILVNDEIVVVDYDRYRGLPRMINLNQYLLPTSDAHTVTLINLNGPMRAWWDFELRHHNQLLWRHSSAGWKEFQLNFAQQLVITSDNSVEERERPLVIAPVAEPITLTLDVQKFALIYVNGFPVAGALDSPSGDFAPLDISPFIEQKKENVIEIKFWSGPGPYRWKVEIQQGQAVWRCLESGRRDAAITASEQFIVDAAGNLIYKNSGGSCQRL